MHVRRSRPFHIPVFHNPMCHNRTAFRHARLQNLACLQNLARLLVSGAVLAGGLFAGSASATVVVLHSLDRMTATADIVVQARVHSSRTVRENNRTITLTEVEVVDGMKGAKAGEILTIYQVGGVYDGRRTEVVGSYNYLDGEELLLFAMRHGERVVSYGVGVGKYAIERSAAGVRVVATYGDVAVMTPRASGGDTIGKPPVAKREPLQTFKATIVQHLANPVLVKSRLRKPQTVDMLRKTKLIRRSHEPVKRAVQGAK